MDETGGPNDPRWVPDLSNQPCFANRYSGRFAPKSACVHCVHRALWCLKSTQFADFRADADCVV
jgi:hypothetical protein